MSKNINGDIKGTCEHIRYIGHLTEIHWILQPEINPKSLTGMFSEIDKGIRKMSKDTSDEFRK